MPYLLPRTIGRKKKLAFILAFGDLSYLEICTAFEERLLRSEQPWSDVALVEMKDEKGGYEKLAGVHKVAVPIGGDKRDWDSSLSNLEDFLKDLEGDFNFSVSLYDRNGLNEKDHAHLTSLVLEAVRHAGLRKANLIRPRHGTEVLAKDIVSRNIIDFVILHNDGNYWIGVTSYIPETQQFQQRSNKRPVVSAEITMSSRLARLLVNISGIHRGQTLLDPFCGSGTVLSEAMLLGASCIGIDRDHVRIRNTRRNLEWISERMKMTDPHYSLHVGDSTRLDGSIGKVDAVVTEPIFLPKVDSALNLDKARKLIRNSVRLYSESIYSIVEVVKKGGRVVLVVPSLRTTAGREVSVLLEDLETVGLRQFQPRSSHFSYPVKISSERTRWVRRLVYVFVRT